MKDDSEYVKQLVNKIASTAKGRKRLKRALDTINDSTLAPGVVWYASGGCGCLVGHCFSDKEKIAANRSGWHAVMDTFGADIHALCYSSRQYKAQSRLGADNLKKLISRTVARKEKACRV